MSSNAFMKSAAKSKRKQTDIERESAGEEGYVGINVRIPKSLYRKIQLHRVDTGESMTALIRRLLTRHFD